ncbi:hypothetical protein NE237_005957 [Protea cynaroides]|uniref:F-box domain-containing protein n=1 Tax=Protea cynaroides TaxID=273540 RepID=A0A9Q0KLC4_9MAGN|nr:hypothetical protein NE237_005957 [Protea cynaroides]
MINILSRLPVKTLSRFKCVSKKWNFLISDPYFIRAHQGRAIQDPDIMKVLWVDQDGLISVCSIEEKEKRVVTIDLIQPNYPDAFPVQAGCVKMAGYPCNGLICITAGGETLVCNPATRNSVVIPRGNNRKYNYVQGLGFCSSSNEFKVVRLFERSEVDESIPKNCGWYGCELFTVGQREDQGTNLLQQSRSWRYVGDLPYQVADPELSNMCYVNGCVHWTIVPINLGNSSEIILSLDLEHEEFTVVSCPENWAKLVSYDLGVHLKELGGELCIVIEADLRDLWDIWVLKDYTDSIWSRDYCIYLEEYPIINSFSVVAICRGRLLLAVNNERFCYYDPRTNFFEQIIEVERIPWFLQLENWEFTYEFLKHTYVSQQRPNQVSVVDDNEQMEEIRMKSEWNKRKIYSAHGSLAWMVVLIASFLFILHDNLLYHFGASMAFGKLS